MNAYRDNNYNLDSKQMIQIGKAVCQSEQAYLLRPESSCRWWSIRYWMGYNEIKLKEQENRQEYKQIEELTIKELCEFQISIDEQIAHLAPLKAVLNEDGYSMLLSSFFDKVVVMKELKAIREAIDNYENYRQLKYKVDQMDILQQKIVDLIYEHTTQAQDVKRYLSHIVEFSILEQIYEIEKSEDIKPDLLSYTRFENITDEINRLMEQKTNLTPDIIKDLWNRRSIQNAYHSGYNEFVRQANKKRMLWPIRKYFSTFQLYLTDLFPCWLLSPETVSDIMPLREGMFDMIIFDEASQMFVENAIPAIFRAKQVVIAGDDQQLRPNVAFKAKYSDLDEEEIAIETSAALEEESLLDLAKVHYNAVHLNYHYRSQYDELINFSNYAFYGRRLQVSPNIVDTGSTHSPIERIKVNGRWRNRTNETEARKVVDLVAAIFKGRKRDETIGIIAFNVNQKDMIEDFLEQRAMRDPDFKRHYMNESNRKVGDEDVSLFVKNIENVQGDERDIIIFSVAYAPDERERVSVNFGSLSMPGGENRLNVAVSRAKKKIYVITSIEPEDLSVDGTKNIGPKLFKKYLQYAKAVSDKDKKEAKNILMSLSDTKLQQAPEYHFDSDFEGEVYEALTAKGYCVHTQVGVSGYKIDLAIYDTNMGRYTLGIECDGAAYHSTKSARERDIHRQRYLVSRGWKILRIWSRNWWLSPQTEIKRIIDALNTQKVTKMDDVIEPRIDNKASDKVKPEIVEPELKPPAKQPIDLRDKTIERKKGTRASVGFGDTVVLVDLATNEIFEVQIEPISLNRHLMKDIEAKLLGLSSNQKFTYEGFDYRIQEVRKKESLTNMDY